MITKRLISVVGPTGIGKTKLAIALANHFKTEIISADSRQFYEEMTIGTAVPSEKELQSAVHHFIQHKSIFTPYSVGDYEREAISFLENFFIKNDIAILVGGSGLYVDAVTEGLDNFPSVSKNIREELNHKLSNQGLSSLQIQLKELDPAYYAQVDLNNPHRVIRALEISIGTGLPYSSFLKKTKPERSFKSSYVGLTTDREIIYDRINMRVDQMIKRGLLDEARGLHPHKKINALQTVGYRELFAHFDGECDLDFAISEIKKNTRRFAKRQLTWYRKHNNVLWIDYDLDIKKAIDLIEEQLKSSIND